MTDRDVPLERDPEWQAIDDLVAFEAKNPNLLRIMKSTIAPDCFTFDVLAIGEP